MLEEIFKISNYPFLQKDGDFARKLIRLLKTYGLLFLAMFAVVPILLLADKLVTDALHHKSLNVQNRQMFQHMFKKLGFLNAYVLICIVGPVFEELIFRFPLTFKKRHLIISALVALFYFGGGIFHPYWIIQKVIIEIVIAIIVFALCTIYIPDTTFNLNLIHKKQLTILSICLFGLMHVFNYQPIDYRLIWIYPVFVIPQMLMGWAMAYTRLKNGFIWGIALHCLINTVSTLLSYRH